MSKSSELKKQDIFSKYMHRSEIWFHVIQILDQFGLNRFVTMIGLFSVPLRSWKVKLLQNVQDNTKKIVSE